MGEAKRRGSYADRRMCPKGGDWKKGKDGPDVAETSVPGRQMRRRFGFPGSATRQEIPATTAG